jgi:hypothetical protein
MMVPLQTFGRVGWSYLCCLQDICLSRMTTLHPFIKRYYIQMEQHLLLHKNQHLNSNANILRYIFNFALCQQISEAQFTCPSWFSAGAKKLITRILDPNPSTVSHYWNMNVEREWFSLSTSTVWVWTLSPFSVSPMPMWLCYLWSAVLLGFPLFFTSGLRFLKY